MTASLRRDDTVIGQLRVRGRPTTSAQVEQAIASASWPTLADDSWVFIRSLHGKTTAQAMVPVLLEQTRQLLGSPGNHQQVQRFANLSELLAHLLTDLATGHAGQRWYWQRWHALFNAAPATAIRRLLAEHLQQLPAITAQLQRQQALATVWQALTGPDAQQLLNELLWMLGASAHGRTLDTIATAALPMPPASLQQRWQPALQALPMGDTRRLLALAVMAQEFAPLVLRHTGESWLAHLDRSLTKRADITTTDARKPLAINPDPMNAIATAVTGNRTETRPVATAMSQTERLADPVIDGATGSDPVAFVPTQLSVGSAAIAQSDRASDKPTGPHNLTPRTHAPDASLPARSADAVHSAAIATPAHTPRTQLELTRTRWQPSTGEPRTAVDHFHTRFGGLLFLLNFLNRSEPRQLMAAHWQTLPSGWHWLFRLGEMLQLDCTDPIANFIANQAGLPDVDALLQTPTLPAKPELLALAEHWYRPTELWQPSLLQLDAEIQFSASHCDLHAAMTQIRLPLRLAGLDINPGWLPWLGRVVTFHYH